MTTCPTCGQTVITDPVELACRGLASHTMQAIIRALAGKQDYVSARDLADAVYRDRPDGGPDSAVSVVKVTIARHGHNLEPHGLRIESRRGQAGGYRLSTMKGGEQ